MDRRLGLLAIGLIGVLTMACAGPSAAASSSKPTSSTQTVNIKTTDALKFDPATVTVKKGTPVHLTLANGSVLEHDWVVDNLDGKKIQVHTAPKTNATADFTPAAAGTHQFYCSIPGHREAGMTGTLIVQ